MNVLLDTHTFLWFVDDNPRLSQSARVLIESDETQPFLSAASLWEIAIKISLGKLTLKQPYEAVEKPLRHEIAVRKSPTLGAKTAFL